MQNFFRAWLGLAIATGTLLLWSDFDLWRHGGHPLLDFAGIIAMLIVMALAGLVGAGIFALIHRHGRRPTFLSCLTVGLIVTFAPLAYDVFEAVRACENTFSVCYLAFGLPINRRYDNFFVAIGTGWARHFVDALVLGLGAYLCLRTWKTPIL